MSNFCGKCGSKLDPVTKACPKCGVVRKNVTLRYVLVSIAAVLVIFALMLTFLREKPIETFLQEIAETSKQLSQIQKYDENGQLRTEIDFIYDQQKVTDIQVKNFSELGIKSSEQACPIEYDADGRVIRYGELGMGRYEEFEYDTDGVLLRHGEAEGGYIETFYEYDSQGCLEETMTTGDGADYVSHYVYDSTGKCTRRDDYSYYDATYYANRTYDLVVYHYRYDDLGNLIEVSGDRSVTAYEYDNLGRKTSEVTKDEYGFIYTTLYNYDYAGLTICDVNYNNNDDFNGGYCSAEIRDANGFLIYSCPFDTGSALSADEEGYLNHIEEATGARIEFLYMESE